MDPLRSHIVALIRGGQAFETFEDAVAEFSGDERALIPDGAEHSAWQIVEHMRISLRDILDFSQNENGTYAEKKWPDEYWPTGPMPSCGAWNVSVTGYLAHRDELEHLIGDSNRDMLAPFAWGSGQTLLREAMLAAEHAAYHIGQLVELKRWTAAAPA